MKFTVLSEQGALSHDGAFAGIGYSGSGQGINNPQAQSIAQKGAGVAGVVRTHTS